MLEKPSDRVYLLKNKVSGTDIEKAYIELNQFKIVQGYHGELT